jgi:hypothetical protein
MSQAIAHVGLLREGTPTARLTVRAAIRCTFMAAFPSEQTRLTVQSDKVHRAREWGLCGTHIVVNACQTAVAV